MDDRARGPIWRFADASFDCGARTLVMGVVNVTPDSFSDGGMFADADAAVAHGLRLEAEGADVLDVGGESTRPGAAEVPVAEELARVVPVIRGLAARATAPISIDTRRAEVARAALEAGARIVNDVSAGRDPGTFDVVRDAGAGLVLMHMRGEPRTMQQAPTYDDVVGEVAAYLRGRVGAATAAGIDPAAIAVDPGIGFGKDLDHNLELLHRLDAIVDLGHPVVVGVSRKRFIGAILDDAPVDDRLEGTAGAVAWSVARGAHVVRVHDVREMRRVVRVVDAIARAGGR